MMLTPCLTSQLLIEKYMAVMRHHRYSLSVGQDPICIHRQAVGTIMRVASPSQAGDRTTVKAYGEFRFTVLGKRSRSGDRICWVVVAHSLYLQVLAQVDHVDELPQLL